jgi:hypothetical protein
MASRRTRPHSPEHANKRQNVNSKYVYPISLDQITNPLDPRAVDDLEAENERTAGGLSFGDKPAAGVRFSAVEDVTSTETWSESEQNLLQDIHQFVAMRGFGSIFDVYLAELQNDSKGSTRLQRNIAQLLSMCSNSSARFSPIPELSDAICMAAETIYQKEFKDMTTSPDLQMPAASLSLTDLLDFSFDKPRLSMEAMAPRFTTLCQNLAAPSRTRTPDQNLQTQTVSGDSDPHDRTIPVSISTIPKRPEENRGTRKNRKLMVTSAISILCYASSQRSNKLQTSMGYFLYACKTPKQVIEVMHCLGLSIGYKTITDAMRSMAESCREEVRGWAKSYPPWQWVFDNMNFYAKKREQRTHHQAEMLNYTVGFLSWNPKMSLTRCLTQLDIDSTLLSQVAAEHILPTPEMNTQHRKVFRYLIWQTMKKYCSPHMAAFKSDGEPLKSFQTPTIYQIPVQRTKLFTLPAFDYNEAKIDEIIKVIRAIQSYVGYNNEMLEGKMIMLQGDWLTTRNARYLV